MEPLSSFAINIAAGIALNIWSKKFNSVDTDIKKTFDSALKKWSKNKIIRDKYENSLKKHLFDIIEKQQLHCTTDEDIMLFIKIFQKELPQFPLAYDYLKEINDNARYSDIIEKFDSQQVYLDKILANIEYDPRELEILLDKLPFNKGEHSVNEAIESLYKQGKIDIKLRESLHIAVRKLYERTNELEEEIECLKQTNKTEFVEILEKIKTALQNRKPERLDEIYLKYKEKERDNKIKLLNELITSSLTMFAYEKTKFYYQELLLVSPSASNHFSFAYFLQEYLFINDALVHYEEALKIYRELAKENPRTYLPDVAMTLNNLAVLQKAKNEFPQALEKYEEALKIRRELAKENPRRYEIDYAKSLIMGVALFKKGKNSLNIAEEILSKYENVPYAIKLLNIINEIKNEE